MSPSGIGIIRISGEDALPVIDRIYRSKYGHKKLSLCESHTIHYGYIYDDNEIDVYKRQPYRHVVVTLKK